MRWVYRCAAPARAEVKAFRGRVFRAPQLTWAVSLVVAVSGLGMLESSPNENKAKGGGETKLGVWRPLEAGVTQMRAQYVPAVVWYPGDEDAQKEAKFFEAFLEKGDFRQKLKRFVLIRLETPDLKKTYPAEKPKGMARGKGQGPPPGGKAGRVPARKAPGQNPGSDGKPLSTVGETLRIVEGDANLVVLDFRERVVRRYDAQDEPPKRSRVQRDLTWIAKRNALFAKRAWSVGKKLIESEQTFRRGDVRGAVLKVRDFENIETRSKLDSVLRRRVEKVLNDYRDRGEKKFAEAAELEEQARKDPPNRARRYEQAVQVYDDVIENYPFRDLVHRASTRKSRIATFLSPPSRFPRAAVGLR